MIEFEQVLVTGGAGFIGSNVCNELLKKGVNITVFDNLSSGNINNLELENKSLSFVKGDIRNPETLEKAAKNCKIFFHLAAQTSVPFSMENPKEDCEINVVGTLNVLEAARKADAKVVFASSSAVYGNPEVKPTPETYPTHPIAFYGLTKLLGEKYCRFYQENYGTEVSILRIFNVYGPNCHGAISDFLKKLKKTPDKLEVLGTGNQARDFIFVSDIVNMLITVAVSSNAVGEVFNAGTGMTTSVAELAKIMVNIMGLKDVDIYFKGGQAWKGDMEVTLADNKKAFNLLHWKPQVSLEEGLERTINPKKY